LAGAGAELFTAAGALAFSAAVAGAGGLEFAGAAGIVAAIALAGSGTNVPLGLAAQMSFASAPVASVPIGIDDRPTITGARAT